MEQSETLDYTPRTLTHIENLEEYSETVISLNGEVLLSYYRDSNTLSLGLSILKLIDERVEAKIIEIGAGGIKEVIRAFR